MLSGSSTFLHKSSGPSGILQCQATGSTNIPSEHQSSHGWGPQPAPYSSSTYARTACWRAEPFSQGGSAWGWVLFLALPSTLFAGIWIQICCTFCFWRSKLQKPIVIWDWSCQNNPPRVPYFVQGKPKPFEGDLRWSVKKTRSGFSMGKPNLANQRNLFSDYVGPGGLACWNTYIEYSEKANTDICIHI